MDKQKGMGLIEVIISSAILALVVAGCLKVIVDANQTQRDINERTIALQKLSSVLEVHRHDPILVDAFTPILLSPSASVAEWVLTDQTTVLPERDRYTAQIEWLNQYDGNMQSFSLVGSHVFGPRHLCIASDCPKLEGTSPVYLVPPEPPGGYNNNDTWSSNGNGHYDDDYNPYAVSCKNGNNGFGNGDASAPGNSGPNNNAANAGNPDREECDKKNNGNGKGNGNGNGNSWKFPK